MSKLFDTLEKIRRHEAVQVPRKSDGPVVKRGRRKPAKRPSWVLPLVLVCVAVGVLYLYSPWAGKRIQWPDLSAVKQMISGEKRANETVSRPEGPPPVQTEKTTEPALAEQGGVAESVKKGETATGSMEFVLLNNQGAEFIRKKDYWKGIYYLEQAMKKDPKAVAPLVNLGVAFSELGFYGLAIRRFKEAQTLDPDHHLLKENLAVLDKAGILKL
ncbi:MAG: tetratricopeptide repeat protein [Desulfobulbaceae bacterium]|nr:tetratricopeptide repeat protein [Desulfobulbaceae bacterium]MCK5403973.1 tetratricopeptide repeat protein [Desulfobulbaceae bacterium]